jgi:hypothetical protein
MKLNSAISKFLTNKLVLHIVSFLALFNVIGYMVIGNYKIVLYFIILAFLIRYFSKNMIVVLGIPLILVNMIAINGSSYFEGLENKDDKKDDDKKDDEKADKKNDKKDDDKEDPTGIGKALSTAKKDATGESVIAASKEKKDHFEVGRKGHKIDYATTIEDAYDQLNSILGKDGIKNLTADTERLLNQQAQLAGSLKDMGPLMEKMGPMMESVTSMMENMPKEQGNDMMNKVQEILGGLSKKNSNN